MSLKTEVFEVLRQNLILVRPEYGSKDVVLCPICMREIPRQAVQDGGIEHVIPENVVKLDNANISGLGTQNQRCGITMLCRQARTCKSDDTTSHDGCNGLKGKLYDRLFRNPFDEQGHHPTEFTHRHGVGILVMAYLGAFQTFGYEYILQQQLAEIREQFDYPDQRKTDWLDSAQFWLPQVQGMVIATDSGHPFVFGLSGRNLEVIFRRCRALLPGGFWVKEPVASLTNLIRSVRTDAAR